MDMQLPTFPRRLLVAFLGFVLVLIHLAAPSQGESPPVVKDASDTPDARLKLKQWPEGKEPLFVIPITGQTYGYLQKCGCSDPQRGGLERRWILFEAMKKRGWELFPIDLGDLAGTGQVRDQTLLKYRIAIESLQLLGYRAMNLGHNEFALPLDEGLAEFGLWKDKSQLFPRLYAGNLVKRDEKFPDPNAKEPASVIQASDLFVARQKSDKVAIGVLGMIGNTEVAGIEKLNPNFRFDEKPLELVERMLKSMKIQVAAQQKANMVGKDEPLILALYQGNEVGARKMAEKFPEISLIVYRSPSADPSSKAAIVQHANGNSTMLLEVGHKGQNVALVGVFRGEKGRLELAYDKVSIDPVFETPAGADAENPVLKKLEEYAKEVQAKNLIARFPKAIHPVQADDKTASFAGSASCQACHPAEHANWAATKHGNAYNALVNIAKRPSGRQFDGECVVCHTVGFSYQTGFDGSPAKMFLKDVGCESCHGPSSAHVAAPDNRVLYAKLSPWKRDRNDRLPDVKKMLQVSAEKEPAKRNDLSQQLFSKQELQTIRRVDDMCQKCHDTDNDPHFVLEVYWPKIVHTGLKAPANVNPASKQP